METNDQDDLPSTLSSGQIPTSVFSEGVWGRMDAPMQYYYDHRCGDPGPHVRRHRSPGQHEPDTVCSCAGTGSRLGIAQSVFSTVYKMCKWGRYLTTVISPERKHLYVFKRLNSFQALPVRSQTASSSHLRSSTRASKDFVLATVTLFLVSSAAALEEFPHTVHFIFNVLALALFAMFPTSKYIVEKSFLIIWSYMKDFSISIYFIFITHWKYVYCDIAFGIWEYF